MQTKTQQACDVEIWNGSEYSRFHKFKGNMVGWDLLLKRKPKQRKTRPNACQDMGNYSFFLWRSFNSEQRGDMPIIRYESGGKKKLSCWFHSSNIKLMLKMHNISRFSTQKNSSPWYAHLPHTKKEKKKLIRVKRIILFMDFSSWLVFFFKGSYKKPSLPVAARKITSLIICPPFFLQKTYTSRRWTRSIKTKMKSSWNVQCHSTKKNRLERIKLWTKKQKSTNQLP